MTATMRTMPVESPRPLTICEACALRAVCVQPCPELERLIGPAHIRAPLEIGSAALLEGRLFASAQPANETTGRAERLATLAPAVRNAVEKLPSIQRFVVYCVFFDGGSQQSVAAQLGADIAFVRRILRVALSTLRTELGTLDELEGRAQ
jgi:DNA-directed RNA polymerase specialized sigma24 family protein